MTVMTQLANGTRPGADKPAEPPPAVRPVGGPVSSAWREDALTRATELEALALWIERVCPKEVADRTPLREGVRRCLAAARQEVNLGPAERLRRGGAQLQRATGNLYAAEALLLDMAPATFLLGHLASILNHVQRHLPATDVRRKELERVAQLVGAKDGDHPLVSPLPSSQKAKLDVITEERGKIVSAFRGAGSAALREMLQVRSFRNVLIVAALVMAGLAVGLGLWGYQNPTLSPLCFQPETDSQTVVVCATAESRMAREAGALPPDIDELVAETTDPMDVIVVELVGLTAATLAAAAALRTIRGSSTSMHLPVALALLKLPTGAVTAYLGLLLMRGGFVPGLSALDTTGQILAWAAVFGYAQQIFTRLVDQQAHSVLDNVRGADKALPAPAAVT